MDLKVEYPRIGMFAFLVDPGIERIRLRFQLRPNSPKLPTSSNSIARMSKKGTSLQVSESVLKVCLLVCLISCFLHS